MGLSSSEDRMKVWLESFWHDTSVWRSDGQTVGQTQSITANMLTRCKNEYLLYISTGSQSGIWEIGIRMTSLPWGLDQINHQGLQPHIRRFSKKPQSVIHLI